MDARRRRPDGRQRTVRAAGVVLLCGVTLAAQGDPLRQTARTFFGSIEPLPAERARAPEVVLGQRLYWDERLSADGRTSCASCHTVEAWGSDDRRFSRDARGHLTGRHSQTVFNATEQSTLRWLGDRTDGVAQAQRSLTGSMGFDHADDVVPLLRQHGYDAAFRDAFPEEPDPVTVITYARAVHAYMATLLTPAPFDAYLAGDDAALTAEQREGLELFVASGCAGCHNGPLLGGMSYRRFGLVQDYWSATGSDPVDVGRHAITQDEADRYVFRTPMLRNIARTAPYFHDGSVATLEEAVRVMALVQSGRALADDDVRKIVRFLGSLTGDVPPNYVKPHAP
jgi:cytochrome c peroxidase